MQKNFIQKHTILIGLIVFCFIFVPSIQESFAQSLPKQEVPVLVINPNKDIQEPAKQSKGKVVLDPGHGGYDEGSSSKDGAKEKDITLNMTLMTGEYLKQEGYEVVYTRTSDTILWKENNIEDLKARSDIANKASADVFVSIHTNYSDVDQTNVVGNEVWIRNSNKKNIELADAVHDKLVSLNYTQDRGIKDDEESPLYILYYNKLPSILIETGFLSNKSDASVLVSKEGQENIAKAIAQGIMEYLEK